MCLTPKVTPVRAPVVAPAPTRAQVEAQAAADRTSLLTETQSLIRRRQGVFGNTTTTPLGDASYGSNVAKFGAVAA